MTNSAQPFDAIDELEALVSTDIMPADVAKLGSTTPQRWHRLSDGRALSYAEFGG